MRTRTTLVLLIVAALLGAYVLLYDAKRPGTDEQERLAGRLFPEVETPSVERLELERPNGSLVLVREDDAYRLLSPIEDAGDRTRCEELIRELLELRAKGTRRADAITGGDEATGLGAAALRALLHTSEQDFALEIGSRPAPGGLRFARMGQGADIALVPERAAELLLTPVNGLRERKIFHPSPLEVATLSIRRKNDQLRFERREGGRWWIASPLVDEADPTAVNDLLSDLASLRADRFAPDDPEATPSKYGFDAPILRVQARGRADNDQETELLVGRQSDPGSGRYYLRTTGRNAIFEVYLAATMKSFERPPEAWRSRRILDFSPWDVAEVELSRGERMLRATRIEGENTPEKSWAVVEGEETDFDPTALADLLATLSEIKAQNLAAPDETRFGRVTARIELDFRDPETAAPVLLELGAHNPAGGVWTRREGRETLMLMDEQIAQKIDPELLRTKEAEATASPLSQAPRSAAPPSESSRIP